MIRQFQDFKTAVIAKDKDALEEMTEINVLEQTATDIENSEGNFPKIDDELKVISFVEINGVSQEGWKKVSDPDLDNIWDISYKWDFYNEELHVKTHFSVRQMSSCTADYSLIYKFKMNRGKLKLFQIEKLKGCRK